MVYLFSYISPICIQLNKLIIITLSNVSTTRSIMLRSL